MNQMIFFSNFKFKHRQQWVANRPSSLHSKGPRGWWRLCSGSKWQDKKQYAQKDRKIHFHTIRNFCTVGMIKHTSTGCPESLLSLHPWRYLKSDWTQHWLMCCSRLGFEQSRLLCLQRCLPTSSVLCFLSKARFPECASVLTDANWSLCISFTERGWGQAQEEKGAILMETKSDMRSRICFRTGSGSRRTRADTTTSK